ncbi:GerAB/ArcD/ProY family transporter [Virgibacillus dakarensis]|uniref:GerAB/ArcD/ProY family transporter n=1 Tax=Virgibacillus dakarensis TaxID=1917889 RepID=UPI000B42D779|nr:endospore germination permease [Virgibacillus dakarensis]
MKWFEYGNEKISHREILVAIPSMVIAVGILSQPRDLAAATVGSDGWILLVVSGGIIVFITWLMARLASKFPRQSFLTYSSKIVTKPVAVVMTFIFIAIAIALAALEVRAISDIAKQYLFDRTPVEIISLSFLLVVVYAVSGSRAGIFRLNLMFLPIILFIAIAVFVFNIGWFSLDNLLPVFETSFTGLGKGLPTGLLSFMGFGIILFYTSLVENPAKVPRSAVIGMCIPVLLYILIFITSIGVFGNAVTSDLIFPTIELAKEVDIPGGFFERFESIFFVIWIMAIFNTTVMAIDVALLALSSIFKNKSKMKHVCILSPLVYVIAMYPEDLLDVSALGGYLSYFAISYTSIVTILLSVIAKVRKVK